ncbi:MAG: LrgB family protein [Cardiobacteriaceae bacterium]|nr:LrgB family protein [Cardiobacteriaceae bacterium]
MKELLSAPATLLLLLLGIYSLCQYARMRTGIFLINPVLWATVFFIAYLSAFDISYEQFKPTGDVVAIWLQPAVVCLALPLYRQWAKIRQQWLPIMVSQLLASVVGIVSGVWIAYGLGASQEVAISLASKSVTMPIALEITQVVGGIAPLTAASVILAGLTGQILGFWVLRRSRVNSKIASALAQGTGSHALGIAASLAISQKFAAYATVGLIFNGLLTSFIAPYLLKYIL